MQLTLVPSDAYPVPQALHTHELRTPAFRPRKASTVPQSWQSARKALANIDLRLPDPLAADATAWWQFAVQAVEWNLELDEVIVTFVDGSEERWDLSPDARLRSSPMVIDSDMEDAQGSPDPHLSVPPPTPSVPAQSRWHPDAVSACLRSFAVKLRSAYEDLGTAAASDPAAPDISSENDFRLLMLLAAEPSREIPFEWSDAQTMYEYAMMGVDDDESDANELEGAHQEGRPNTWRDELRRPSQGRRLDIDEPGDVDPFKYTGHFRSRRRDTVKKTRNGHAAKGYDYLSVIDLLSQIRTYLCELFPATVIPVLRERLPPTYTLWAVDGAIVWARREAIRKARGAAELSTLLLDDDGDCFDYGTKSTTSAGSSQGSATHDIIIDDSFDMLDRVADFDEWQAEERRQERLANNPLRLLRDDYELRNWCVDVIERARMLELSDDGSRDAYTPDWIRPVPSFDVAAAIGNYSSDSDRNSRRKRRFRLSEVGPSSSPPSSPLGCSADGGSPSELSRSDSETETSDFDELSDEDIRVSATRVSDDFFYPPDPLSEGFLPRRLPKELVEPNVQRGPELEEARMHLYRALNQIAGLQNKIAELHELVKRETRIWEDAQEEKTEEKTPWLSTVTTSSLRNPRTIPGPPPNGVRRRHPPKPSAPLLKLTGDRALERSLDQAYRSVDSPSMPKRVKASRVPLSLSRQLPRKRQRQNLETYSKLAAMSTYVLDDGDDVSDDDDELLQAPRPKKRRMSGNSYPKKKKKRANGTGRDLRPKRPPLERNSPLQHATDRHDGAERPSDSANRHLAALGLSDRRRQVLQALADDTGIGDSSIESFAVDWLEADLSVDLGPAEEQQEERRSRDEEEPTRPEADDEVDELEEVDINPSKVHTDLAQETTAKTGSLLYELGEAGGAELEAPTRFPSPFNNVSGLTAPPAFCPPAAAPLFTPLRPTSSPIYPISAERSWQQEPNSDFQRPTSTTPPGTPPFSTSVSSIASGSVANDLQRLQQQLAAPFAVPRARVLSLSPPSIARRSSSGGSITPADTAAEVTQTAAKSASASAERHL
ncbi:hypothetical protein JCM10908_004549 [Rhodotorula pacifica]|uniref:uncharacterized protein n=1 Tax=Rhodotorula pacifica TaxID=1495444 RepID=UPI00317DEF55